MIRSYIRLGSFERPLFLLVAGWLAFMATSSQAQTTLNVTNFGARGDAVQFSVNTTSNSVVVTTTNRLSSADIGKVIELFGAGQWGVSNLYHQDLLATITNVVNATNLYISRVAGASTNGCQGVYGHNNATNFQACINAAPSNTVINIPAGTYLIIGQSNFVSTFSPTLFITYPSITISKGGLTLQGKNQTNTILLGCGAWQNKGSYAYRGFMFACQGPVTNNGPLIFDSLTLDGGVQQGLTSYHYWPARTTDGDGWDVTHDAVIDMGSAPFHILKTFRNCHIMRWRGEQLKSVAPNWDCPPPGPAIIISNCVISDGDATALNFSFSHRVVGCTFSNLDEIEEYYQGYATNVSVMQNCMATNIVGALMAFNGALSNSINPTYTIQSNVFYLQNGQNGIQTCPVQNLTVANNQFIGNGQAITIGIAGYQGSAINSNIMVANNIFTNVSVCISVRGAGQNILANMVVSNNTAYYSSGGTAGFAYGYGWGTNMLFVDNKTYGPFYGLNSTLLLGQWYLDDISNTFQTNSQSDTTGRTNTITYATGMRQQIWVNVTNSVWVIDDTHPQQVPPGAVLQINSSGNFPVSLYFSASMSGTPIVLATGQTVSYQWTNGVWVNISSATNAPAVIQVTPGSISYGTVLNGTSVTNSFTVMNVGSGTLSGAASVGAPFSIVSGGNYSLSANGSQTVTVVFSPSGAGSYNQSVTFTGGGGTNAVVSGSATNAPVLNPIIQVTPGSISYGTVLSGTSKTNSFTVQNVGSGTLSGTASVGTPFSILSGGNYSLSANQGQTVTVAFSPSGAGSYNQSVTFTGGGGTNTSVSGSATNVPPVLPTVSAISANVPDVDTNMAGFQIYVGTTVQLSASALAPNGDALTWQWLYSTNGSSQTVYQSGSGTAPTNSFTYPNGTAGNTYVWTLQVTDSKTQLSAQSQLTLSVLLVPPQGLRITSN